MGKAFDSIVFHGKNCDGCGDCVTACVKAKGGSDALSSRIKILPDGAGGFELALCRQCGEAKCVMNCPSGALTKNGDSGVIDWADDKCVNCLLCTVGCAYGGITYEAQIGHVIKCDQCGGQPACVAACPHDALAFSTIAGIYNSYGDKEDMFAPGLSACQGCNSELLIRHTMRRIGPNAVVAAPPGCIPGMGTVGYNGKTGAKVPIFHPLLTNTSSMLAGIRRYYERQGRDVTVVALAGDGGTVDVGFQALSGAAERGEHILYICVDNEGYMNTGMQSSGSTNYGSWTSTTPVGPSLKGKRSDGKNLPMVMMMHNCAYVATASLSHMEDYYAKLDQALETSKNGFAYVHVYAPCPSGWRFHSSKTIDICRLGVETNFIPLWEFTPKGGLRFTLPTENPRPITDYLKAIGKYRHLEPAQIEHIQHLADERLSLLSKFVRDTGARPAAE
ncbi:MAG: phenylglyoxylate dehydrogenase [Rhodospirillales bacterium]|nr:phenylglyoxylate dehydrogenase [Rhodospirillales bacterium]